MNAKLKKAKRVSVLVCCASLLLGLVAGGAAGKRGSILEQVTKIEDPELGELLRKALVNSPEVQNDKAAKSALVKRVTDAYLQIKLLTDQIGETDKKLESSRTTEIIKAELLLAKKELEAKLGMQLAELREVLNIVPEAAYKRPVKDLDTWLALDVIGGVGPDVVCVYEYSKPFYERPSPLDLTKSECRLDKIVSGQDAVAYVKDLVESKEHFPLRLDIFRNRDGAALSEELKKQINKIVEDAKLDMNPVEVYLAGGPRADVHIAECVLREGTRAYWRNKPEVGGRPEDFFPFFTDICLRRPQQLPLRVHVEFDEESRALVQQWDQSIRQAANKLELGRLVGIEGLRYAFGRRKDVEVLNSWLRLQVTGGFVYVSAREKPYSGYVFPVRDHACRPVKLMSVAEAVEYVTDLAENEDKRPFRLDIERNIPSRKPSEELYQQIVKMVRNAKLEDDAEVYLDPGTFNHVNDSFLLVTNGMLYKSWPERGADPESWLGMIVGGLSRSMMLPKTYIIEYDHESEDLARRMAGDIQKAVEELGLEPVIESALTEIELAPEQDFSSWFELEVWGRQVAVIKKHKPYLQGHRKRVQNPGLNWMSQEEMVVYVENLIKNPDNLPLRIGISSNKFGVEFSQELAGQLKQVVKDAGLETEAQIHLAEEVLPKIHISGYVLRQSKIYLKGHDEPMSMLVFLSVNQRFIGGYNPKHRDWRMKYAIEFDKESEDLALRMSENLKGIADNFRQGAYLEVELKESEP